MLVKTFCPLIFLVERAIEPEVTIGLGGPRYIFAGDTGTYSVALQNLIQRTGLPGMRALVNALLQTEKYGTPLSQSLRVLAAEMRTERLMKAEEKAARLPATLTIPMVLFILPCLFVVPIGPAILDVIDGLKNL